MNRFLPCSLVALAALSLSGCLTAAEPKCTSTDYAPIVSAIGPKTVAVNQPAVFVLGYALGSDCGVFNSVVAVPTGNVQQIGVKGTYNGCACNPITTVAQTPYQFQASTPGTYYLQFLTTNNTFITDTLVVK